MGTHWKDSQCGPEEAQTDVGDGGWDTPVCGSRLRPDPWGPTSLSGCVPPSLARLHPEQEHPLQSVGDGEEGQSEPSSVTILRSNVTLSDHKSHKYFGC